MTNHINFKNILPIPNLNKAEALKYIPRTINTVKSDLITLKHILKPPNSKPDNISAIYKIPCSSCNSYYIGETNNINTRIYQHKYDLKIDNLNSSLSIHRRNFNHTINPNNTTIIKNINNTDNRKIIESYIIKNTKNFNTQKGEIKIDNSINLYLNKSIWLKNILKSTI